MPSKAHRSKEACRRWASLLVYIYIHIFIFIIQVHCLTCTLGLLSHVAPCIMTEDGLKCVKSIVLMIESLLPQLLDGSANINIPACLIQYHYSLLLISYLLSETHSPLYNQPLLLSSASNLHTIAKMFLYFFHRALPTDPLLSLHTISSPSFNSQCSTTSS